MNLNDILAVAGNMGWRTIVTPAYNSQSFVDFLWETKGGQYIAFSAVWDMLNPEELIEDIEDFETSFNLNRYLDESLEETGALPLSRYFETIHELEDIHTRVWLLWVNLKYLFQKEQNHLNFPPFCWN